jgi:hypothetical protein
MNFLIYFDIFQVIIIGKPEINIILYFIKNSLPDHKYQNDSAISK